MTDPHHARDNRDYSEAGDIHEMTCPREYQRLIADVWGQPGHLNFWLLDSMLAWRTDDTGSVVGGRDIDDLRGIPEEIRDQVRVT